MERAGGVLLSCHPATPGPNWRNLLPRTLVGCVPFMGGRNRLKRRIPTGFGTVEESSDHSPATRTLHAGNPFYEQCQGQCHDATTLVSTPRYHHLKILRDSLR